MNEDVITVHHTTHEFDVNMSALLNCVPTSILTEALDDKFRFAAHTHEDNGKNAVPVGDIDIDSRSL